MQHVDVEIFAITNACWRFINVLARETSIKSASKVDSASHQRLWSRGYDSRLGLSQDIKCERSQVRVLATACSFAFWRLSGVFGVVVVPRECRSVLRITGRALEASSGTRSLSARSGGVDWTL